MAPKNDAATRRAMRSCQPSCSPKSGNPERGARTLAVAALDAPDGGRDGVAVNGATTIHEAEEAGALAFFPVGLMRHQDSLALEQFVCSAVLFEAGPVEDSAERRERERGVLPNAPRATGPALIVNAHARPFQEGVPLLATQPRGVPVCDAEEGQSLLAEELTRLFEGFRGLLVLPRIGFCQAALDCGSESALGEPIIVVNL